MNTLVDNSNLASLQLNDIITASNRIAAATELMSAGGARTINITVTGSDPAAVGSYLATHLRLQGAFALMRVRAALDGVDISSAALVESLTIRQDSREAISTCELTLRDTAAGARYDVARYDVGRYGVALEVREWQQLALTDQDTGQLLFAGFVLTIGRGQESNSIRSQLAASDWGILFERAVITQSWPANTLDSTIVTDLLAHVPGITAGTIVPQIGNLGALEAKDARLRDVLDEVCELTGSEWSVSYDGKLNYYRTGSVVAPFALTDNAPNGTSTVGYQLESYANDFTDAANRVLALGGLIEGGEIRASADEWASQAKYGILAATVIDRNITDAQTAALWAQTEIAHAGVAEADDHGGPLQVWPGARHDGVGFVRHLRLCRVARAAFAYAHDRRARPRARARAGPYRQIQRRARGAAARSGVPAAADAAPAGRPHDRPARAARARLDRRRLVREHDLAGVYRLGEAALARSGTSIRRMRSSC